MALFKRSDRENRKAARAGIKEARGAGKEAKLKATSEGDSKGKLAEKKALSPEEEADQKDLTDKVAAHKRQKRESSLLRQKSTRKN
tara:strand:+ start:74 stop:331 length:258 start_codon:yes stop_codon:yes gene_type:complete